MADSRFELIVVGGGPAGYVAAIRARQLGLATALVECEHLGGICLNWGCIPTKALLRAAEIYRNCQQAEAYGLRVQSLSFDATRLVNRSRQVADQLCGGIKHLLKKNGVEVFWGHGRLKGPGKVHVSLPTGDLQLSAPHIVLATGARARSLPGLEPDGQSIWSYKEAMIPKAIPDSLLVIGSGAIGIEFASFYLTLGSKVTVVELQERILPAEDEEISALARENFERQGMRILTRAQLQNLDSNGQGGCIAVVQSASGSATIEVEKVIIAVGIVGNTEDLGLDTVGVRVDGQHIVVDRWLQTTQPGIYAIGDVAGAPWLAHKASHEGVLCVEHIAGCDGLHPIDYSRIPGCTYSHPQIASIGLSQAKAQAEGYSNLKIGRFPFVGNGKALALGESDGLVKTIFDADSGQLLGAHMIGAEVTELIQGYGIAQTLEATESELMQTVFPHPTLSEMMHESVLAAYGRAIHI